MTGTKYNVNNLLNTVKSGVLLDIADKNKLINKRNNEGDNTFKKCGFQKISHFILTTKVIK